MKSFLLLQKQGRKLWPAMQAAPPHFIKKKRGCVVGLLPHHTASLLPATSMSHPSFWQNEHMSFSGGCAALFSEEKVEIASSFAAGNLNLFFCLLGEGRLCKPQKSEEW